MKKARKLSLSREPAAIGLLGGDTLFELNPGDICRHAFGFKWLWLDGLPLALNADEIHWKRLSRPLKMVALPLAVKAVGATLAMNYGVHVGSSLAFEALCVPHTIWDIAQSIVSTASPVCGFLLSTMQVTQNTFAVTITTTVAALVAGALSP